MKNKINGLFEKGDVVEVLANKNDIFNDFCGTVMEYVSNGILKVRDQEDDVFQVGENQCERV